jgi:hypothetical protein
MSFLLLLDLGVSSKFYLDFDSLLDVGYGPDLQSDFGSSGILEFLGIRFNRESYPILLRIGLSTGFIGPRL